jgi:2-dehydropantoate 2-reductase
MPFKNILIVGGGAIGGITGAVLTEQGENVVVLDTDKKHVKRMRDGLEISGLRQMRVPVKAVLAEEFSKGAFKESADIVLLSVKALHTRAALTAILPSVSQDAPVVSLQNGINEESIAEIIGEQRTIGCIILWGGTNEGPGRLVQTADGGFIIGQWPKGASQRVQGVAQLLSKVVPTEVSDNIIGHLWSKLLITTSMTGVGTVAGLTYGGVIDNELARLVALTVVTETYEVGKALGVDFAEVEGVQPSIFTIHNRSDFDAVSKLMEYGFRNSREIYPSMLQDIEKGRKTEVEFVNGYVVKKGAEVGIKTPANELVTKIIKQIEGGEKSASVHNLEEFRKIVALIT